jgi:hypothetical protein
MTNRLSVPVIGSLTLDAGACCAGRNSITILPPSTAMFDQLLDWLSPKAAPDHAVFGAQSIGIGATALCLRWGSYLAALLDESKPPDRRIGSPGISMIADSEMKRINLECSSNLARLIRMLHEDEANCCRLLHLAQQNLPMPRFRFRQFMDPFEALQRLVSSVSWELAGTDYRDRLDRAQPIVTLHPYRVLGNSLALAAWRNGPVEEIHRGWAAGHSLDHRRVTDDQCRELISFTSGRLSVLLSKFRPWIQSPGPAPSWPENLAGIQISPRFTCSSWSLTESCSVVELEPPEPTPKPAI